MRGLLFASLCVLAGCFPGETERCDQLQSELERCIGSRLGRLDCATLADADVDRALTLLEGTSCGLIADSLPVDGDPMSLACRVAGVGCVPSSTPMPERKPTKFPIVLVNGIDTSPLFRYSQRIVRTLREAGGHQVFLATLTPYETPRRRAPELLERVKAVLAQTGAEKVNLVCHSLGGLDCRYLTSPNGLGLDLNEPNLARHVASVTTFGTAHRGTRVADVMLGLMPDQKQGEYIERFAAIAGDWFSDEVLLHDVHLRDALTALTLANAPAFNAEITDAPGVYYQSWAGWARPFGEATREHDETLVRLCQPDQGPGLVLPLVHDHMALTLVPFDQVVAGQDVVPAPHDGLTPVASARWGRFRGCVPMDHMEQLGQRNLPDVNVRTGYDVARFYAEIAADLAQGGF